MGQRVGVPSTSNDKSYGSCELAKLQNMILERGLARTRRGGLLKTDRRTLIAILKAYDMGAQAAFDIQRPCEMAHGRGPEASTSSTADDMVIQTLIDAAGFKGLDIGGTLVKLVIALPLESEDENRYPESFGKTGRTRYDLEFIVDLDNKAYVLRFVSGATAQIHSALQGIRPHDAKCKGNNVFNLEDNVLGMLPTLLGRKAPQLPELDRCDEGAADKGAGPTGLIARSSPSCQLPKVYTAGGGAHKFAPFFRDSASVELVPVKELTAVVDGFLFLAQHDCHNHELVTVDEENQPISMPWPEDLFPLLLVNMGSGVSILRVDSSRKGDFVRIGGTACGGGTFLGLAMALTSAETFEEALALAEGGDAASADLLVRDIYGNEGSESLGLPGSLTAANFGRLCEQSDGDQPNVSEQDLARSLLQMVTQQSVLLATAFAKQAGCIDRVFFVGGFTEEANHLARATITNNFRSLGGRAYFLRHCDYLCALGSLRSCLSAEGRGVVCKGSNLSEA
eukprot:gnl/TRDRNA2_/TRDRNA2_179234_c0_seq1.p1 gnl/TRDRNA2_/TRDRNA2_179234_c0~~gnl/TRDRNA2_/TRDRNA2_179234_c0_seq1.p1  ORF type:complete len:510 (-),score=92.54 gnl/TRDRNA2_/TRDRNA2_179234_c0_seq1:602-2131(-)